MAFSSLLHTFFQQVETRPDATALWVTKDGRLDRVSWQQLHDAVAIVSQRIAQKFEDCPALPLRIGYRSENSASDVLIALASMSLGAIEVPFDHRLNPAEIDQRWERVRGLWLDSEFCRSLSSLFQEQQSVPWNPVEVLPNQPALILWTSGTAGSAKGVILSHGNLLANAKAKLKAVPQASDDVRLTVLPLAHAYARTCDFATWLLSGCEWSVALGFKGLRLYAPQILPTLMNTVPSIANRLLEEDSQEMGIDRLSLLGCGGAALSEEAFGEWKSRGVTVIQGYGLTETSPVICSATPENATAGLVGNFVDGWEHQIRDGQLFVRGPQVMLGYWQDAMATAVRIDSQGWLATGDLVERDIQSGQLRILGRADDVLVLANGCKVHPQAIEQKVQMIAGVRHAMLVHFDALELWIDVGTQEPEDEAIQRVLSRFPQLGTCQIKRFDPALCLSSGELTAKNTIRRKAICANRFNR